MGCCQSQNFSYEAQLFADHKLQSKEIKEGTKPEGETWPRTRLDGLGKLEYIPLFADEPEPCRTLWDCIRHSSRKYPNNPAIGTRVYDLDEKKKYKIDPKAKCAIRGDFVYDTHQEVFDNAVALGRALTALGLQKGDNFGIFSDNRVEWLTSAFAAYSQGYTVTSLYATLGEDAVEYVVNHAECKVVLTSKENIAYLLNVAPRASCMKYIIFIDYTEKYGNSGDVLNPEDKTKAEEAGVEIVTYNQLLERGGKMDTPLNLPQENDIAYLMYTSGTTGPPKGALLKHSNMISCIMGLKHYIDAQPTDRWLSYLPLAHIFEAFSEFYVIAVGARVGYYSGNIRLIASDLSTFKPTVFAGVPRIFLKFHERVMGAVAESGWVKKQLFMSVYNSACSTVRQGKPVGAKTDVQFFKPIRDKIGLSEVRLICSGAAPLQPYLGEFMKVIMGGRIPVIQGYGMTECSGATTCGMPDDYLLSHVGIPLECSHIKLVDVPDMNYLASQNKGEVWIRGPHVFAGYYKNPEASAEMLRDGWLCTGDVGRWNPNGTLSIIDRKKNIFKLSQGEYVAAEKLEQVYMESPFISQIYIYGNAFKSFVVAVVVPNAEQVLAVAVSKGWWPIRKEGVQLGSPQFLEDFDNLFTGPHGKAATQLIKDSLTRLNSKLKPFEHVKDIIIESKLDGLLSGFTVENDCMTPTFKLKRAQLGRRYAKQLKALYTKNGEAPKADEIWPDDAAPPSPSPATKSPTSASPKSPGPAAVVPSSSSSSSSSSSKANANGDGDGGSSPSNSGKEDKEKEGKEKEEKEGKEGKEEKEEKEDKSGQEEAAGSSDNDDFVRVNV